MPNVDISKLKRKWHCHKHENKTCFQLGCFLACISLLLKCVVSEEKCAEIYPTSDVYVVIGESIDLFCITNGSFSADYLEFRWQGKVMNTTVKINDTAIKLVATPKPRERKNSVTYLCKSNYNNCQGTTSKVVVASLPPRKIKDFQCMSENFDTLNCSWISPDDIETKYEVLYEDFRGKLKRQTDKKNAYRRYCLWNSETYPPYRSDAKNFTILIKSSNNLGSANETKYIADHFSIVKPAAVENLSKVGVSPQHVKLQWEVHDNLVRYYFGVYEYKIICDLIGKADESKHIKTVQHYSNNLSTHNKVVTFNLTGLPYAHMQYRVRVYMKPDNASEKFWSEPSEIYVNTSSEIPRRPPDAPSGSFHQIIFEKDRQIKIYWKELEENEEAGPNFRYNISIKHGTVQFFNETTEGFLRVDNAPKEDILVLIWAENEIGKSINASSLYIPFTSTPQVSSLTKHAYNNGSYKLSWMGLHNVDNYTIFWCPYTIKNICTDRLNYTVVGIRENNFMITLPRDTYQFAISGNCPEATNGMTWTVCDTYQDTAKSDFDIKFTRHSKLAKTSVELHWSLNCILEEGYLRRYIIGYCPKGFPSGECNSTASYKQHELIRGLKPYTTYVFTIKLDTVYGIKSINETNDILTLPDTPTSPRNINISTVFNDSLIIHLDPPYPLNGDKGDIIYKIFNVTSSSSIRLASSFEIPITVSNLKSFSNYSLSLQACNVKIESCSNKTDNIFVRTRIGEPDRLETPTYEPNGTNKFVFKWKEPNKRGSDVVFYQIKIIKDSKEEVFNVTKSHDAKFEPCDEGVDNIGFKVRAVNNDSDAQHGALADSDRVFLPKQDHGVFTLFYGEWSEERSVPCERPADLIVLYLFAVVFLTILLGYLVRKYYRMVQAKKDIYPIFAQGLFPSNEIPPTTVNENRSILNKIWLLLCKRSQMRANQYNQQTSLKSNKPLMSQDNHLEEHLISKSPYTISITECLSSNQNIPTTSTCEDVEPCIKIKIQPLPDSNTKPDRISNNITENKHSEKIELHLTGNGNKIIEPKITNNEDSLLRSKFEVPKPIVNPKMGYVQSSFTKVFKNVNPVANTQTGYVHIGIVPEVNDITTECLSINQNIQATSACEDVDSCIKIKMHTSSDRNSKPDCISNNNITEKQHSEKIGLHLKGNENQTIEPKITNYEDSLLINKFEVPKPTVNPKSGYVRSSFTNKSKHLKPVASTQTGYVHIGIVPEVNDNTTKCLSSNQNIQAISACNDVDPSIEIKMQPSSDRNSKSVRISNNITEPKHSETIGLHLNGNENKTMEPKITNNEDSLLRNKFEDPKSIVNPKTGYVHSSKNACKNLKLIANIQTGYVQIGIAPEISEPAISTISILNDIIS